jgi:carboxylesterase
MSTLNPFLHNPHLDGAPFVLSGTNAWAVLLFHGFTATCFEVRGLGLALHHAGYTVAAPLLPGHGTRPQDLNHTRWQDWIAAADSAYTDLAARFQHVVVGGESNGGLVALSLAAAHPEIAAVLTYAPALRLPFPRWKIGLVYGLAPLMSSLSKGDMSGDPDWQGYRVNPLRGLVQLLQLQTQVRLNLPQVHQPLLVIQGKCDQTIDPKSAEMVYSTVQSTVKEIHWMEHSSHCVLLDREQPLVFQKTLDFLTRVKNTSA